MNGPKRTHSRAPLISRPSTGQQRQHEQDHAEQSQL